MSRIHETLPGLAPKGNERNETADVQSLLRQIPLILTAVQEVRQLLQSRRKENLTVEEFAELVCRAPYTVRQWINSGRIQATRVPGTGPRGRLLIARDQLPRLVRAGLASQVDEASLA